jgi:hypothetical protein
MGGNWGRNGYGYAGWEETGGEMVKVMLYGRKPGEKWLRLYCMGGNRGRNG